MVPVKFRWFLIFFPGITCFQLLFFYRSLVLVLKICQNTCKKAKKNRQVQLILGKILNFCRYSDRSNTWKKGNTWNSLKNTWRFFLLFYSYLEKFLKQIPNTCRKKIYLETGHTWKKIKNHRNFTGILYWMTHLEMNHYDDWPVRWVTIMIGYQEREIKKKYFRENGEKILKF